MTYATEVLTDSPLLYWRFNSGGADSSGNSRPSDSGTPGSSVAGLLVGDADGATAFNGSNQYFVKNYGSWMNTSAITLEVWIKTTTSAQSIIASRDNTNRAWQLRIETTGRISFVRIFNASGATDVVVATSVTAVNNGSPHHVAVTYSGSSCLIYIDGALDSTTSIANGLLASGTSAVDVARYHDNTLYLNGTLDELAWYGAVLTSTRIAAHYAAGITGGTPTTVAVPQPAVATALGGNAEQHEGISVTTDTSNAGDGRSRGGVGVVVVTYPVEPTPPGLTLGERVDKTIAYPTPTMVGGRPT